MWPQLPGRPAGRGIPAVLWRSLSRSCSGKDACAVAKAGGIVAGAVEIRGLRELNRAMAVCAAEVRKGMQAELKKAGEPVRSAAQELAMGNIRNMTPRWSEMKVGATSKVVYVAPEARRRGGSRRPNLAVLLLTKALEPAADAKQEEVRAGIEAWVDTLVGRHF